MLKDKNFGLRLEDQDFTEIKNFAKKRGSTPSGVLNGLIKWFISLDDNARGMVVMGRTPDKVYPPLVSAVLQKFDNKSEQEQIDMAETILLSLRNSVLK